MSGAICNLIARYVASRSTEVTGKVTPQKPLYRTHFRVVGWFCNFVASKNMYIRESGFNSIRVRVCACEYTQTSIKGGYTVTNPKKVTRSTLWQKKKS